MCGLKVIGYTIRNFHINTFSHRLYTRFILHLNKWIVREKEITKKTKSTHLLCNSCHRYWFPTRQKRKRKKRTRKKSLWYSWDSNRGHLHYKANYDLLTEAKFSHTYNMWSQEALSFICITTFNKKFDHVPDTWLKNGDHTSDSP